MCSAPSRLLSRGSRTTAWSRSRPRCIPPETTRTAPKSSRPSRTSGSRARRGQLRLTPRGIGSPRPCATLSTYGATVARSCRSLALAASARRQDILAWTTPSHGPRTTTFCQRRSARPRTLSTLLPCPTCPPHTPLALCRSLHPRPPHLQAYCVGV